MYRDMSKTHEVVTNENYGKLRDTYKCTIPLKNGKFPSEDSESETNNSFVAKNEEKEENSSQESELG